MTPHFASLPTIRGLAKNERLKVSGDQNNYQVINIEVKIELALDGDSELGASVGHLLDFSIVLKEYVSSGFGHLKI